MDENTIKYILDNIDEYMEHAKNIKHPPISRCVVLPYIKEGEKMNIEIKVDRIKKYKIVDIDVLSKEQLPNEYLNGYPNVQKYGNGVLLKYMDNKRNDIFNYVSIGKGGEFTESEMRILIHHIRLAGERLGRINQKIKRENDKKEKKTPPKPIEDWSGSYTFEV